jgi:hypothetical protein
LLKVQPAPGVVDGRNEHGNPHLAGKRQTERAKNIGLGS